MPSIRSFIALPAAEAVRDKIVLHLKELIQLNADVRWELPEKFHITLKFLGNVEPQVLEKLTEALGTEATHHSSFDLVYQSFGAFPNFEKPRVVWVGTVDNNSVLALQKSVERVCAEFGVARDERVFHPHITLGRVKGTRNIQRLTEKLKSITLEPTMSRCTELLVMRSDLHPSGSVYSVAQSIPLKP
ncbi:MAG TPA: RNA 2',3'-cyclic phosphodiesterase [Bacteroidota bacterium]